MSWAGCERFMGGGGMTPPSLAPPAVVVAARLSNPQPLVSDDTLLELVNTEVGPSQKRLCLLSEVTVEKAWLHL